MRKLFAVDKLSLKSESRCGTLQSGVVTMQVDTAWEMLPGGKLQHRPEWRIALTNS